MSEAKIAGGKALDVPQSGTLGPVTFPERGALRIEVVLTEPRRFAMEVEAHEA
jgi:hypothetical protein